MIYQVKGELVLIDGPLAVIDCMGVGYAVTVSLTTAEQLATKIGSETRLLTHMQVKEDGVELFGFGSREELSVFRLLIGISGVGPKAAMSILSIFTPDRFAYAVCTEDTRAISRAPGIGAKTAALIVLKLKDKMSKEQMTGTASLSSAAPIGARPTVGGVLNEAADALGVLGYSRAEIADVLRRIDTTGMKLEDVITAALKKFSEQ